MSYLWRSKCKKTTSEEKEEPVVCLCRLWKERRFPDRVIIELASLVVPGVDDNSRETGPLTRILCKKRRQEHT